MAGNEATGDKFYEAVNESSDAIIDAAKAANDRTHRVTAALIEQAQESQRESMELMQKWAASPFDVFGLFSTLTEAATRGQGRALEVTRMWFGELSESQKETRDLIQRLMGANRNAGQATAELARSMVSRAGEAVQAAREASVTEGNGRKLVPETPSSSESSLSNP